MIPNRMAGNENGNEQKYNYENVIGGLPGLVSALKGKKSGSIAKLTRYENRLSLSNPERILGKDGNEYYWQAYPVKGIFNSWYLMNKDYMPGRPSKDFIWNNYLHHDHGHFEVY